MHGQSHEITRRIDAVRQSLNPTLRRIADTVLERTLDAKAMSIRELAEACAVSQASVSRFVRTVGADNYQDFRIMLAEGLSRRETQAPATPQPEVYEGIGAGDDAATIVAKVTAQQAEIVRNTAMSLDPGALQRAADMVGAHRTLIFLGVGSSLLAAEDGVMRFLRIGKACVYNRDPNIQLFSVVGLSGQAVVIGVSNSGRTQTTVEAMREARSLGMPTIAITSSGHSPLARTADVVLLTPGAGGRADADEEMYESMVSKMAQLAVMDALYAMVAVKDHAAAVGRLGYTDGVIARSRIR